jgi:hypothetical protein
MPTAPRSTSLSTRRPILLRFHRIRSHPITITPIIHRYCTLISDWCLGRRRRRLLEAWVDPGDRAIIKVHKIRLPRRGCLLLPSCGQWPKCWVCVCRIRVEATLLLVLKTIQFVGNVVRRAAAEWPIQRSLSSVQNLHALKLVFKNFEIVLYIVLWLCFRPGHDRGRVLAHS